MAKIFYVVEKAEDYITAHFFKTEKEALTYGIAEFPDFDMFDEPMEDSENGVYLHGDSIDFKKGILFSFEEGLSYVQAMDEDEAREYSNDLGEEGATIFFDKFTKGMYGYLGNGADGKGRKWDWDGGRFNESKIQNTRKLKFVKLFEEFINTSGFLKIFIGHAYDRQQEQYAKKFAKTRSEKELSFMKSLECAKTPNKAFKKQLKKVEEMISWHETEIKKQGIVIKKAIKDSKEFKKDPNTKKAMAMAEELSQNIGSDGVGRPSKIKYGYDYEWKTWDLTSSDELAGDKFVADIFKEWEAESAKAEKMDDQFWKYTETLELASYS